MSTLTPKIRAAYHSFQQYRNRSTRFEPQPRWRRHPQGYRHQPVADPVGGRHAEPWPRRQGLLIQLWSDPRGRCNPAGERRDVQSISRRSASDRRCCTLEPATVSAATAARGVAVSSGKLESNPTLWISGFLICVA